MAEWKTVFVDGPTWQAAQLPAGWYFGLWSIGEVGTEFEGDEGFELDTLVGPHDTQAIATEEARWALADMWASDSDFRAVNTPLMFEGVEVSP